jgi:hypothetical protein
MDHVPPLSIKIREMVRKSVIAFTPDQIEAINRWITSPNGLSQGNVFIDTYMREIGVHIESLTRVSPNGDGISKSCILSSGLFCFLGQILLYTCQGGSLDRKTMDNIVSFTLLYLYTDYYLDGGCDTRVLRLMEEMIHDPYCYDTIPGMEDMVREYRNVLSSRPTCRTHMISVFNAEVDGLKCQKDPNLTSKEYLAAAEKKGGATSVAIQAMFGLSSHMDQVYNLGVIVQLLDDMMDVYEDQGLSIHTIATHELQVKGSMDRLWCYTATKIDQIGDPFLIFRLFMMEMLLYVLGEHRCFTRRLKEMFSDMIHVDYCKGSHMMEIVSKILTSPL